jgi:hypothetical protein
MPNVLKALALFVAILVGLLALPLFLLPEGEQAPPPTHGLPWQIEKLSAGGTRVFGLVPGRSTLKETRELLGQDVKVALVIAPGETGSLEAFYDSVNAGGVTGKMVLTLASTPAQREGMLQRARRAEYMQSTTRRIDLAEVDLAHAQSATIEAITFIPAANLDEQIVLQRFGQPAERIRSGEHVEHFLYPDRGLDLILDRNGKEVLQYVAPRDFARIREPLLAKR